MNSNQLTASHFPLCNIQSAYFVGAQQALSLSTTAQIYSEIEFEACDPNILQQTWRDLVARHPMLRAIVLDDGTQYVLDEVKPYEMVFHDLGGLDPADRASRYEEIRQTIMVRDLPLNQWPQFCVQISSDGDRFRLHLRFNLWMIDAVSILILRYEMFELYGRPLTALPNLETSFHDYIQSIAAVNEAPDTQLARAYWHKRLSSLPLGPELPLKCAPDKISKPVFSHLEEKISADNWAKLNSIAKQYRLTCNVVALAAYAAALAKWSKRRHFTITILASLRPFLGEEMANVIGNFGTTVLLEIKANSGQTFVEFASAIQKQMLSDIQNIAVSGIEIGREMNRVADTPLRLIAPITFTSVQYNIGESYHETMQCCARLSVPQVYLDHQLVEEPQGHVTLSWDFVQDLWHKSVIEDMFRVYAELLQTLSTDASAWRKNIALTLPVSHQQILENYNDTAGRSYDCTLDQLVADRITKQPDRPALINGDVTLTYGQLGLYSDELSDYLAQLEIRTGQLIGVILPKEWRQIVAVLAISRAGCAYVPIDPELPPSRQRQLIEQAEISIVLTSSILATQLDLPRDVRCVYVDKFNGLPVKRRTAPSHSPDDTAYVIFTSGSTGVPKGVVISHRGAVNTILDVNSRLGIAAEDKVLALSSLSFDLSVYDIFGPLAAGGTVILPTPAEQQSPEAWASLINQYRITVWNSVPALFQLLVDCGLQDGITLPSIKYVLLSGDWIPRALPEQAKAITHDARLFSLGGATEASIWSVIYEIEALDDSWRSIPYGRPLTNQHLYVLDDDFEACPIWKSGELYIGGSGLALGYLNDPTRTHERFIINPWTKQRLYRTGDLARMRPDGNMEFLGREDHQIKIRGFRIELGEIESFILQQPAVLTTIVKVIGADDASKRLIAFVVLKPGASMAPETLRDALFKVLPRYMVPETVHVLESLPLSPNGKIDHRRLDELSGPPKTATEQCRGAILDERQKELLDVLAPIWEEVLAVKDIDPNLSFFSLGGTSFQALQLVAKVRKEFGTQLRLANMSSNLSLYDMVAQIRQQHVQLETNEQTILRLRPEAFGNTPALFCIHPVGGRAHCYIPLVSHIAPGVPVFGIQSTLGSEASPSIESLSEQYVSMILQTDSIGPYMILGWSMGAAIACEVTRRLQEIGRSVVFTGLIDPYCAAQGSADITWAELLYAFCDNLAGLSGRRFMRPSFTQLPAFRDKDREVIFLEIMQEMLQQSILPSGAPIEELREVFRVFEKNTHALLAYVPSMLNAEVTVFYAEEGVYRGGHYLKRWRPEAIRLHEMSFEADHFTIMQQPSIIKIAEKINHHVSAFSN